MLIILGWLTNHFFIKHISREASFRVEKYLPEIPLTMGIMGAMLLMGSTANLNTGRHHPQWHFFCATRFFLFTVLALIYNTVLYCIIYVQTKKVSLYNLIFKVLLLAGIFIQFFIGYYYGSSLDNSASDTKSVIGVILEWTLTITVIANFYSMALDVDGFVFIYTI
jgi:hypothetical protein